MAMVEANNEAVLAGGAPEPEADLHRSGIIPQLQNMVATVNLGCKLELKQIALHARNSEYNPKASCSLELPFASEYRQRTSPKPNFIPPLKVFAVRRDLQR